MAALPNLAGLPAADYEQYHRVRARSVALAAGLSAEDCAVQSMPDASPVKWHLAHTTWFFETMILAGQPGYRVFDERFGYLFNSYYEGLGPRHPRPRRGLLTRPSLDDVMAYRAHVDAAMEKAIAERGDGLSEFFRLGLHHEEQHQELILQARTFRQSAFAGLHQRDAGPRHRCGTRLARPSRRTGRDRPSRRAIRLRQ
jgi:hypothetical protein